MTARSHSARSGFVDKALGIVNQWSAPGKQHSTARAGLLDSKLLLASPCKNQSPLLHRYIDGEMDRNTRTMLDRHLKTCRNCQQYVAMLQLEEISLVQNSGGKDCDFGDLWQHRLLTKLSVEQIHAIGVAVFHWLAARIWQRAEQPGAFLHQYCRGNVSGVVPVGVEQAITAIEIAVLRVPGSPPLYRLRRAVDAGDEPAALRSYRQLDSNDAPPYLWCLLLHSLGRGDLALARSIRDQVWDTPAPVKSVFDHWIAGTASPLPRTQFETVRDFCC